MPLAAPLTARRLLIAAALLVSALFLAAAPAPAPAATVSTFSTAGPIAAGAPTIEAPITVAGLPARLDALEVVLHGLVHPRPADLHLFLVAPDGRAVTLLSGVGGTAPVWGADLVLADGAAPIGAAIGAGTWAPSSNGTPTPPDGVTGALLTTLGALSGSDPNGTWRVVLHDDASGLPTPGEGLAGVTLRLQTVSRVGFASPVLNVDEAQQAAVVVVTRPDGGSAGTVDYATAPLTAVPGKDYTPTSGTLRFSAGQESAVITVPVLNDKIRDPFDTFNVVLSNPSGDAGVAPDAVSALVTIDDDNAPTVATLFPFDINAPIAVPGVGTIGPAAPYPSTFTVQNIDVPVYALRVSLRRVTHSCPRDIAVRVIAPDGRWAMLMAGAGGCHPGADAATLQFDSAATAPLPASGPIPSGTYQPTVIGPLPPFPQPLPTGVQVETLADLRTGNVNGTWQLEAIDTASGDSGSFAGGWTLGLQVAAPTRVARPQQVVREGVRGAAVRVLRIDPTDAASVRYRMIGRSARNGINFRATSGVLHFEAGQRSATIPLTVFDDGVATAPLSFSVALSAPTGDAWIVPVYRATRVVIADADRGGPISMGRPRRTASGLALPLTAGSAGTVRVLVRCAAGCPRAGLLLGRLALTHLERGTSVARVTIAAARRGLLGRRGLRLQIIVTFTPAGGRPLTILGVSALR